MNEPEGVFVHDVIPRGDAATRPAPQVPAARFDTVVGLANDDRWVQDARCRDEDASLFFGPNRFEPKRERLVREAAAKRVCLSCPALQVCREHALTNEEPYGVWGGLGEHDRREVLARGSHATAV